MSEKPNHGKKTLVVGVTNNPGRYAYKAVESLLRNGHKVVALGPRPGEVLGLDVLTGSPALEDIHTITLYINPMRQPAMYEYLFSLSPKRIIFNPGTENDEFIEMAKQKGIVAEVACTLVLLSIGEY